MHLLLTLLTLFSAIGETARVDTVWYTDSGEAEFTSDVPLHTFTGRSDHLTGMIDTQRNVIDFYIDLQTFRTGVDRRDRDMARTLSIDEHPFAEFTGELDTAFDENATEPQPVTARGRFTVHGVTQDLTVEGTLARQGDRLLLEAEWILDITDYEIRPPGILFYRVRDEIEVRIRAGLRAVDPDSL